VEALNFLSLSFDALLGAGLLWLAWQALACTDLFKAIVLFIAFGLLMAIAWVRLDAPDVALAEAAIGAGLTGALLLAAFAKLRITTLSASDVETFGRKSTRSLSVRWLMILAIPWLAAGLGFVVLSLTPYAAGLRAEVSANLANSGVSNPVTAVLLNFRGYDTLLEMAVLLVTLLGVWTFGVAEKNQDHDSRPVLDTLVRFLIPLVILVAAYLLWAGAHAPGGAFQAGAVLSAAGVLLLLAGWRLPVRLERMPLRLVLVAGLTVFIIIAIGTTLSNGRLLQFPPEHAGVLILVIELIAMLSIGATLTLLFAGGRPDEKENQ
jgi:multisubunit Na+/H+ antiporter MnhB subunit